MNHTPNSSDNLFLRGHASLRSKHLKLPGALMLLALTPLLLMFLLVLWFGQFQLQRDIATQADQTGSELARQIGTLIADPLAANDTLSLNIILAQWAQSPMVAHISLTSAENRIVAEAGRKPSADNLAPGQGRFVAAVHFQDELIGQLHLSLSRAPFTAPSGSLVQSLLWSLALLAIVAGLIAWRLGAGMRRVLAGLGNWYGDTGIAPPGIRRSDELGDLARRLAERRITDLPPLPEPEPEPEPDPEVIDEMLNDVLLDDPSSTAEPDSLADENIEPLIESQAEGEAEEPEIDSPVAATDTPVTGPLATADIAAIVDEHLAELPEPPTPLAPASTVLAIRLGNQHTLHRLPRPRLLGLLERYREQLDQVSRACGGQLHTLLDGTSLIFFHPQQADQLGDALFCGELMRVLGHELQIQIADTGVALHVQIALCHTPCQDIAPDEMQERSPDCAQMLERMQHSRNLLLLDAELATSGLLNDKVVVRRLASQSGVYCVERLKEPYQSQLERHLELLSNQ
ncbi:Uncharacterized membrane protein affecting hemolysin expression [Halopseudomonas litoralis]|uniref:Uncharacterized membrane protein affecting hemolysin expression n=1 Tax=Halopseudomonas litoralis TaxID=797277 RepID=A0A1H1TZZ1_9GAMM|nr:hypothetical protein [Halopseudomonas litoralis]SDS65763.1 Uncharacterized membrane protein affecting hemolysin expression [Halopseudomonas litoralis]